MKLNKLKYISFLLVIAFSCDSTDLDLQTNPDTLTLESADPDLVFNTVQGNLFFLDFGLSGFTTRLTRLAYLFGSYGDAVSQTAMNGAWNTLYTNNNNVEALADFAETDELYYHLGAAQIIKAKNYLTVTDFIGQAVYTEANNPTEFPNPNFDDGSVVYNALFTEIDEGIINLEKGARAPTTDIWGEGIAQNWINYGNSLKLMMYLQTRLVDENASRAGINALISEGELIDELEEDFEFQFGSTGGAVESRHPLFVANYISGTPTTGYQPNGLMSYMKDSMAVQDPRMTYYFYRQTLQNPDDPDLDLLRCDGNPDYLFCYVGDGYWGRDHADNDGVPGDTNLRTTYGIYPVGGQYDDGAGIPASSTPATGAGIYPLMLSAWVNFALAEAALELGTTGNAVAYLESGIRLHMEKVFSFAPGNHDATDIQAYVDEVVAEYNAATDAGKLDIIIREWYLTSFGSGVLAYNNYRRTGYPSFLQDPIIAAGNFPRSFFIPESELNSNANPDLEQKSLTDKVFWDTNPDGFIN